MSTRTFEPPLNGFDGAESNGGQRGWDRLRWSLASRSCVGGQGRWACELGDASPSGRSTCRRTLRRAAYG
ncbi:hypothetical protein RMP42_05838 [Roseomonas mucosa]|nr:hypothetical protein RMP42_05838 [Roseomonas mucosa]